MLGQKFSFKNNTIVKFHKAHLILNLLGGSSSSGGSGDQLHVQEDTVFISGMDPIITEQDIAQHFGSIGIIKVNNKAAVQ
jgi:RNA recognition motif-containing protein